MITHVVFDLGNVVFTNDDFQNFSPSATKRFMETYEVTKDEIERGFRAAWYDFERGKVTEEEFWANVFDEIGLGMVDATYAKDIYRSAQAVNGTMPELVQKIRETHKVAVLSNVSKEWFEYKTTLAPITEIFSVIVTSFRVGAAKPERKIYETLITETGAKPECILFIDDSERNLAVAREFGIQTIKFKNQEQLETDLKQIRIL